MRVFLIAGEPSGDKLGAALMQGLRELRADVQFSGVGGPLMQAQGMDSLFPMDELSVMGLAEILPKYRHLKRRIAQTAAEIVAQTPDVLITIDSPDFCLRVARQVREAQPSQRIVHYVAPTVWAWRPGRAAKMAQFVDQVLALFPFEPPYMQAHGMRCDFVGHPVVAEPMASQAEAEAFRARHDLNGPLVLALPGSRRGEVSRLSQRFGAALAQFSALNPGTQVVLPAAAPVVDLVRAQTADWPVQPLILDPLGQDPQEATAQKYAAFRAADLALAASGTVSLELAAAGTPMVIAYDMSWMSRLIISRMLRVDTVTLVNLVSETRVVPEFIGVNCKAGAIAEALCDAFANPQAQRAAMELTMQRLGQGAQPPGLRAARAVLQGLKMLPEDTQL